MIKLRQWSIQLPVIFSLIVASFVAATVFTQWRTAAIDRSALAIAQNAAPSIEHLVTARGELRHMQFLLATSLDRASQGKPFDAREVQESRRRIDASVDVYRGLPVFPGEQELWADIGEAGDQLDDAIARSIAQAEQGDLRAALDTSRRDVANSAEALSEAFTRDIEFNARQSRALALKIGSIRTRSQDVALVLSVVCALVTIAGAVTLRRAMNAYTELAESHRELLQERAAELEQFAGRVAHDILSPLGTVAMALELSTRADVDVRSRAIERGERALERVKQLVVDLLGFARAGARPEPGARAEVTDTLADLTGELVTTASAAGVELAVDTGAPSAVACSRGVLTSLVTNLVHNAIKYIEGGSARRVQVRALDREGSVRVEVEDTGPGLPPGFEEHAFDPYVRGGTGTQPGIGLGLATVKRMIEGHGGHVGVRSVPGRGCTFWFELPKAATQGQHAVA